MKYNLLYERVPSYMRTPFINSGYRLGGTSKEALISLFKWHNETMNAWTLLVIPIISTIIYSFLYFNGFLTNYKDILVLFLMPLHTIIHAPFSVCNHLMSPLDIKTHYWWRHCDVAGTHFSSFLLSIPLTFYVFSHYAIILYLVQGLVSGMLIYYEYIQYLNDRRGWNRVFKVSLVTLEVTLYLLPVIYTNTIYSYLIPLVLLFGGICYGFHIPERLVPNKFDILLQGNTIMHLTLLIAHLLEYSFILDRLV